MRTTAGSLTRIVIATSFISLTMGMTSFAADTSGHDWYCPDPEGHANYEKHRKQYHNYDADAVAGIIETIYSDAALNTSERKEKTIEILNDYMAKVKLGTGD